MTGTMQCFRYLQTGEEDIRYIGIRAPNVTTVIKCDRTLLKEHPCGQIFLQQLASKQHDENKLLATFLIDVMTNDILDAVEGAGQMGSGSFADRTYSTVQDYYNPSIIWLELCVRDNQITLDSVESQHPVEEWLPFMDADRIQVRPRFLSIDASQLRVVHSGEDSEIQRDPNLLVHHENDTTKLYNFVSLPIERSYDAEDRLNALIPMRIRDYDIKNRINRIEALVHYAGDPDKILGQLQQHIESSGTLDDYMYNDDDDDGNDKKLTAALRDKWASQLRETIYALHKRRIMLGDIPQSSIVIDAKNEDAWITSFDFAWDHADPDPEAKAYADERAYVEWIIQEIVEACP